MLKAAIRGVDRLSQKRVVGDSGKGMISPLFPPITYKQVSEFGSFPSSWDDAARGPHHGLLMSIFFLNNDLVSGVLSSQQECYETAILHGLFLLRLERLCHFLLLQIPSAHGWPPDGGLSALTKLLLVRPPCCMQGVTLFPFLLVKTDLPCSLSFLGSALCQQPFG